MDKVPYRLAQSVGFIPYSSDEIRKLSVLEVTNPLILDSLDHPSEGGLHDRAFGPVEQLDMCSTCGLNSFHCPGHCGHINLPLPVFNPLFLTVLNKLLRGSCLSCHRLTAPAGTVQLALHQFQALDYGLIGTVQELEEVISDPTLVGRHKSSADMSLAMTQKLKEILEKAISEIDLEEAKASARVKNVVETRQRIMKKFIKDHLTGSRGKCPHCAARKVTLTLRNNCRFVLSQGQKKIVVRSKASSSGIKQEKDAEENVNDPEVSDGIRGNSDLNAKEVKSHLYALWDNDGTLLGRLFAMLLVAEESHANPMDIFFTDVVLVPPSRFRPISQIKGNKLMSPRTASLREILLDSVLLNSLLLKMKNVEITDGEKESLSKVIGKNDNEKLHTLWYNLQGHVNAILDAQLDKQNKKRQKYPGVKQTLEAKEGLFRGRMMGKRVNYVARSVISPDPYLMVDEIGVPEVFAKKLTYPEPVTHWNYEKLSAAVLNGPNIHPGAFAVESEDGRVTRLTTERMRYALAAMLLTRESHSTLNKRPKIVHRHLRNGDVVLLNRQPTLHKPSIMAHRARVLPGEKTLRLHYANCKSYNADFDGDEMNAHFPQNEIARSEGYNVVSVNHQYLVPKDGTPLSGLIQDHIVAGTLLTMRGTFFTREEYQQLVYNSIPFVQTIKTLPPCIMKPQILWSGKQVVSTIIINVIPKGKQLITVEGKTKLSSKNWQNAPQRYCEAGGMLENDNMTESEVIIHSGELLCGILDKAHIGPTPYGLVHCCYELYGGQTSNHLLTSLARLFTYYLRAYSSFTLGIEDILLTHKATKKRERVLKKVKEVGDEAAAKALNVMDETNSSELLQKLREAHLMRDPAGLKQLDFEMKKKTDHFNNKINKICMPEGLQKKFPKNNLQLLVQAGAKGSTVNTMQISCLLGQVELEGRRVPLMLNGSTLPSFHSYDTSPRAGGFVAGRFLNGIRPQEYFFHCMAGREGLIDTAVKTSRSGYLQRCLIKHLEGVMVNYDMTVRDSDGSVIQFLYGEDGLDVTKMQMLKAKQFSTLAKNYKAVINKEEVKFLMSRQDSEDPALYKEAISHWQKKYGTNSGMAVTNRLKKPKKKCPDPLTSVMRPDTTFGSVSEKLDNIIDEYIKKNPDGLISHEKKPGHKSLKPKMFRKMMYYRALRSLSQPGEPVGLLAAQSIGEPSTQMTLNTFHFAGRGEMNVTLGIPRLREILMVASANIATPNMDLPLLSIPNVEEKAEKLRVELTAVHLNQVLQYVEITDEIHVNSKSDRYREYQVKMKFLPPKAYEGDLYATPESIFCYIEKIFIKKVVEALRKKLSIMTKDQLITSSVAREHNAYFDSENDNPEETQADADESVSSDEEEGDDDTLAAKSRAYRNQDVGYDEKEEEDKIDLSEDEDSDFLTEAVKEEAVSEAEENSEFSDCGKLSALYKDVTDADKASRINFVRGIHRWVSRYDYDMKKRKCEFSLKLDLENSATDMKTLIEDEISKAVVHELPKIKRAFLVRDPHSKTSEKKMLKTEGVNFLKIFKYDNIIDMSRIYSNDIHAIANFFGIEAATRVIVKEVSSVFAIYGIEVDPRHLLLIADYMTFDGTYKPFNRFGLESNPSPLQQMSFETTLNFFRNATLTGAQDMLKSPSAKLVVGQLVGGGTGSFDLFVNPYLEKSKKK